MIHYRRQKVRNFGPALYAPVKPPDRVCQNTSKNPYKITGALAKAVISTIEAVGSACMRFAADHREQVRGDTPPGANRGEQVMRRSARRSNHWAEIAHNFYRPKREKMCACWARRAGDNIGKQCRHKNGEFCAIGGILRSVKKRLLFLRGCAKIYCCKNIRMSVLLKEV